jgi:hypothetical protein
MHGCAARWVGRVFRVSWTVACANSVARVSKRRVRMGKSDAKGLPDMESSCSRLESIPYILFARVCVVWPTST